MAKNINDEVIIETSAILANEFGVENLTLKLIAEKLDIKSPSLYNHISGLEDLKYKLMLYGWKELGMRLIDSAVGVSGYDAIRSMCEAFYDYATQNKGIFDVMLWYNKFDNEETNKTTGKLFEYLLRIIRQLNISESNANHLIRTLRAFLEGYALLVNNNAFGNPISIRESFELSLDVIISGIKTYENK